MTQTAHKYLPHDSAKWLRRCCPYCCGRDIIGPYEMDGVADGKYQPRGLFWITCRECNRTARVDPSRMHPAEDCQPEP